MPFKKAASALALTSALLLAGCAGMRPTAGPGQVTMATLQGSVYGGRSPISGATIQMWQAGTSGYGLTPTPLYSTTSSPTGTFTLTGHYSCTSGTQVYVTSTSGNTGSGANNTAAVLMAALGLCDNVPSLTFVAMNELTTVAGVWALAPFMNGTAIGTAAGNTTGLANGFADAASLVNVVTGYASTSTATMTFPSTEIYTLGDILAGCINTTGAGNSGCDNLFNYTTPPSYVAGGTKPSNTLTAAINIARYPANNAANLLPLALALGPYQPRMSTANDFTLAVTITGSGISAPTGLALDASGNVWVANSGGNSVTELSHTAASVGTSPYSVGGLSAPTAIAIDTFGDAWVTNGNSTLTELSSSGAKVGTSPFMGGGLSTPTALAFDGQGDIWISNSGNSKLSEFSSAGAPISSTGYSATGMSAPVGVAIDPR